jgi:O-acetyl-ADP-ribose deacetylase (regulator of RNase III)
MDKMEREAVVEVVVGEHRADIVLDELESIDDLTEAVIEAAEHARPEIVIDLRCRDRPAVPLIAAMEAAIDALREVEAAAKLRFLVASERVAESLRGRGGTAGGRSSKWRTGEMEVELLIGDITAVAAAAVVNASNTMLKLGAGVSGALRRACGPGLQADMAARAPIAPGGLAVTGAHGLATTRSIIHVATASGEPEIVERALRNVLRFCAEHSIFSVAIPGLGMGTGGLARARCAEIFRDVLADRTETAAPRLVRVVLWTAADFEAFENALSHDRRFEPGGEVAIRRS